jgi:hypothetical protein
MKRLGGDTIADFDGRHVRGKIGEPGVSQPLECGWWNGLLKVSQNGTPEKARIDLNLCARVASIHADSPGVFVRRVRTLSAIVTPRESGCNYGSRMYLFRSEEMG